VTGIYWSGEWKRMLWEIGRAQVKQIGLTKSYDSPIKSKTLWHFSMFWNQVAKSSTASQSWTPFTKILLPPLRSYFRVDVHLKNIIKFFKNFKILNFSTQPLLKKNLKKPIGCLNLFCTNTPPMKLDFFNSCWLEFSSIAVHRSSNWPRNC